MDITQECIVWDGGLTSTGYGYKYEDGKQLAMHRLVWEKEHGPIPKGMHIRHKCDNKPCMLLEHLEIGTPKDNTRDYIERLRPPLPTHCKRGHEMIGDNLGRCKTQGHRFCKACRKINIKKWTRGSHLPPLKKICKRGHEDMRADKDGTGQHCCTCSRNRKRDVAADRKARQS